MTVYLFWDGPQSFEEWIFLRFTLYSRSGFVSSIINISEKDGCAHYVVGRLMVTVFRQTTWYMFCPARPIWKLQRLWNRVGVIEIYHSPKWPARWFCGHGGFNCLARKPIGQINERSFRTLPLYLISGFICRIPEEMEYSWVLLMFSIIPPSRSHTPGYLRVGIGA